jgi:VIT1/CCC1 family predicted Fe2+/Mn2+ transporter
VMLASCSMGITATVVAKFVDRSIGRWPLRGSGLVAAAMVCLCCCLRKVQVRL